MKRHFVRTVAAVCLLTALFTSNVNADDSFKDVEIITQLANGNVYMMAGRGGNLGLSVGSDGAFLIDDQFAPLTDRILAAVAELSDKPVKFVINTHWHPDHTGGNENLGKDDVVIVAHQNVRKRLSVEGFIELFNLKSAPMPAAGLPDITFTDDVTFHLNDDDIHVMHVKNAHTDGDAIVHFRQANVIHTGDTYFAGMYPFIDSDSGGSVDGVIKAIDHVLALADDKTVIIPGHGGISNKRELGAYRGMLQTISGRIRNMITTDNTLEQVQASQPTRDFDEQYGGGFIKNEVFVEMLYKDMTPGGH